VLWFLSLRPMSISAPRLFDHDPDTGMTEYFHYDQHTGGFVIETQQDVSAIIDLNRHRYNATERSTKYGDGLEQIASIPNVVLMDLAKQQIVSPTGQILDDRKYRQWLNDPANEAFRVRRGKV
jgi:hypothetical protein